MGVSIGINIRSAGEWGHHMLTKQFLQFLRLITHRLATSVKSPAADSEVYSSMLKIQLFF